MSALIGLGMLLHGLAGYENNKQRVRKDARLDKLDERQAQLDAQNAERQSWDRETADARRRERENQYAVDKAVTEEMAVGTARPGFGSQSGSDQYFNKNQKDAQTVANINAAAEEMAAGPAGDQGAQPPIEPGTVTPAKAVGESGGRSRLFTGLNAAAQAKQFTDENPTTSYAKYTALSERLAGMAGGQDKADAYLKRAKEAEKEGAFKALTMLDAGDADGAMRAWNSTGAKRLEAGQKFVTAAGEGGKIHQVVNADGSVAVPNVEQAMLRYLSGFEGMAKQADARAQAASALAAERFKIENDPSKRFLQVRPGTAVYDTVGANAGKKVIDNTMGYVEDVNGNLVRPGKYSNTGGGAGGEGDGDGRSGKGKKPEDPVTTTTKAIMDVVKESAESKTLSADQLIGVQATARELVANAARRNEQLDPYVAGKVALTAVLRPESVKPGYDATTGAFNSTVAYNGNTFPVGRLDPASMPEAQLKGVAQTFVSKLSADDKADYIKAAAGDAATRTRINADIVAAHGKEWTARFTAANGRRPTKQDVDASIARSQGIVDQNISLVGASGAVEQDKKQRETASKRSDQATAQKAIGTPDSIMALPPGEAQRIYAEYGQYTTAFQREALQLKMARDRRNLAVGGLRQP